MNAAIEVRRHGDVLIKTTQGFTIPKGVKLKSQKLIHKGTNNSHVIGKGEAKIGELEGKKFLRVVKPAVVSHVGGSATHATKPLPKGDYWVEVQNFYDHMSEEAKKVVD
jgi:hypothetical protein